MTEVVKPMFDIVTNWELEADPEELTAIVLDPEALHFWSPSIFMKTKLIERGQTEQVFTRPREVRTEDYVTGRFG